MNLKLTRAVILIMALMQTSTAVAEVTVGDWLNNKETWLMYVGGVGSGISWANSLIEIKGQTPIYCPPDKLSLNAQNYASIIDKTLENDRSLSREMSLAMVLLLGYQRTFPCTKK